MYTPDKEMQNAYKAECNRILSTYRPQMKQVFAYCESELGPDFLGFINVYQPEAEHIPDDFVIIDFGCYQAVQALYFAEKAGYIGIDNGLPVDARFPQENASYYSCSIQEFIRDVFPFLGIEKEKVFAVCSYVPDKEAQQMVLDEFPYHKVVYCEEILGYHLPEKEKEQER